MMDYYEPMTIIHMTDDLQLVTKSKKKKVSFAPDVINTLYSFKDWNLSPQI